MYELRIYTIKPNKLNELMKLWGQNYKYIKKYFDCRGIWTSDSGTLNQVYHIYKWKNYNQRSSQKKKFADNVKMKKYVKTVKNLYLKQENIFLNSVDFL